jgi:hypothetical protein
MGVLDTAYTFTATDIVTSTKLNNVLDQAVFTAGAIATGNTTLAVTTAGALKVNSLGITANELADNSVTQVKTNNFLVPTGAVMAFGMTTVPAGWLACDGQSTAAYPALAALVGANVPDLRGYFVRGTGTNSDGTVSGAFGAKQTDEFKSHNHNISVLGIVGGTNPGVTDSGQNSTQSYTTTTTGSTETRPRNIALLYCIKY